MCPSFLVGNEHSFKQAGLINRLADSAQRIETPLAALTLIKEVPDSVFDQFVTAPLLTVDEFLLDSLSQIGW